MSRIPPYEYLLRNLAQSIPKEHDAYLSKEEALRDLKQLTKQDFGYDTQAWFKWLREKDKLEYQEPMSILSLLRNLFIKRR